MCLIPSKFSNELPDSNKIYNYLESKSWHNKFQKLGKAFWGFKVQSTDAISLYPSKINTIFLIKRLSFWLNIFFFNTASYVRELISDKIILFIFCSYIHDKFIYIMLQNSLFYQVIHAEILNNGNHYCWKRYQSPPSTLGLSWYISFLEKHYYQKQQLQSEFLSLLYSHYCAQFVP